MPQVTAGQPGLQPPELPACQEKAVQKLELAASSTSALNHSPSDPASRPAPLCHDAAQLWQRPLDRPLPATGPHTLLRPACHAQCSTGKLKLRHAPGSAPALLACQGMACACACVPAWGPEAAMHGGQLDSMPDCGDACSLVWQLWQPIQTLPASASQHPADPTATECLTSWTARLALRCSMSKGGRHW